jgi:hypothetical protein
MAKYAEGMLRTCSVSYVDTTGVEHRVDVVADSLYEAGLRAVAAFRQMPLDGALAPGPATQLRIEVRGPEHNVRVQKLFDWLERGGSRSPKEHAVKCELRSLVGT